MATADTTLPDWLAAFIGIINANNEDAFVAAFADDGLVDDWGRRFVGHDAIRRWSGKEFIGVQVQLKVLRCKVTERWVDVDTLVGGNGFNGPRPFRFQAEHGHVVRMRIRGSNPLLNLVSEIRGALGRPITA